MSDVQSADSMGRPRVEGLRHVALFVTDLERSLKFYRDVMGMELEWMPDPDNAYLTSGSDNLALHRRPSAGHPGGGQPAIPVLDHIGFVVSLPEDVDRWARFLGDAGVDLLMAPKTHRDGARSRIPTGYESRLSTSPPYPGRVHDLEVGVYAWLLAAIAVG